MRDGQVGQQRATQHFEHPQQHPARPTDQHRAPPAPAVGGRLHRHKTQVIHLLADLRDERDADRQGCTKQRDIKSGTTFLSNVV